MSKMILSFLILFALAFVGVKLFVAATGREKIQLIKSLGYSMVITVVVMSIIAGIVILF
jgi:predicted tellurium resistance membrane protein TerC